MGKATTVDEYFAALPDTQRRTLRKLRAQIRTVVPDAIEGISYGMRHISSAAGRSFVSARRQTTAA